jgi:hypothetical protein
MVNTSESVFFIVVLLRFLVLWCSKTWNFTMWEKGQFRPVLDHFYFPAAAAIARLAASSSTFR